MPEFYFDICDSCPHEKTCTAGNCNMREELLDKLEWEVFDKILNEDVPNMIKVWKKSNKIEREY